MRSLSVLAALAAASVAVCTLLAEALRAQPARAEHAVPQPLFEGATPDKFPAIARPELVASSLDALRGHGWDLEAGQVSLHTVVCIDLETCARVADWGAANGFQAREARTLYGHGGIPQYSQDLVCDCVLSPEEVNAQGRRIHGMTSQDSDAVYATWVAERVR